MFKQSDSFLRAFGRYLGLESFFIQIDELAAFDRKVRINLYKEFDINLQDPEFDNFKKIADEIVGLVKNSEMVKDIVHDYECRNVELQEQVKKLTEENQELFKFKTHYDMEYALRNGK